MRGSPLRLVIPGEDGKLRLGGGGGGDLEGFSVRYRGTVSSSGKKKKERNSDILGTEVHLHNMSTVILEQAMMHLKALRGVLCEFFYKWSSRDWR